ncbi:plasma membrane-associated cation-binding protein 1-like [Curcuma longa]|uniref:plasma membrane-associated cation-binding protein 1-like n=1 Tax=Curcuma longa TaxID=136217 RepID=UPI003D9ECAB7
MASNWRSRLFPTIKKVFVFGSSKKTAATEACKSFEELQEEITKEFEERKTELEPKAVEIYQASDAEIKALVKNPTEAGIKKKSTAVVKFIEELVKIEFPGSKQVSEAASKYGVALVPAPIVFILEKVSSLVPGEDEVDPGSVAGAKEATSSELGGEKEEAAVVAEETTAAASSPPSPAGNAPATAMLVAEPTPPETATKQPEQPAKA